MLFTAAFLVAPTLAFAQDDDGAFSFEDISAPAEEPAPAPAPRPVPEPVSAPEASKEPQSHRPTEPWTFGLGAGWSFPQDLLVPNTASARIAFPGWVTLEPFIRLSVAHQASSSRSDAPSFADPIEDESSALSMRFGGGTLARIPIFSRGNVDLQLLGGASVTHTTALLDFGDDAEGTDHITNASINWGLGIEWFFWRNMAFSIDARNPLLTWTRTQEDRLTPRTFIDPDTGEEETEIVESTSVDSFLSAGAIFNPTVVMMFHFYF